MLNATSVKTEEDLVKLLMELGFDSDILPSRHPMFENLPARLIYANK
ncbi:MAG: hypothetical protein GY797_09505 [Deltaproteobacteria bacterium]|nr:hypothetical protein [Deltaproteobacteria bacterium]